MMKYLMTGLCSLTLVVATVGCGGNGDPPPITDEVSEQVQQEDAEVMDEESEL